MRPRVLFDCDGAKTRERESNRRNYQRHKAKRLAEVKAWKLANPERARAYQRKHWEIHKERVKQERAARRAEAFASAPKEAWLDETFRAARVRAKRRGIPFDAVAPAVALPDICPVLDIEIHYHARNGVHSPNSPSLDRIIPHLGYVAGNIRVISNRANTLKNNASLDEMRRVLADMEGLAR